MTPAGGAHVVRAPRAMSAVRATLTPPGSKSLTQRFMLLAALADGVSTIENPLVSADTQAFATGLGVLGAKIRWPVGGALVIQGVDGLFPSGGNLHAMDGGTPARFLMAAACLARVPCVLDGSVRLRERPMRDGVDILNSLGAHLVSTSNAQLPIQITPTQAFRQGGLCRVSTVASSQFISALALIAPWLERGIEVRVQGEQASGSYIDLTVDCLRKVGAAAAWRAADGVLRVEPTRLKSFHIAVEPDASSAVYGMALAAICPGSEICIAGLPRSSHQPDIAVLDALVEMGARDHSTNRGATIAFGSRPKGASLDASRWPDGSLAVMAVAAFASAPVALCGLSTLAAKESDRLSAMALWLRDIGVAVEMGADWIRIDGTNMNSNEIRVNPFDDHRIAMSAAVAGAVRGKISVADGACVGKSWPSFWNDWHRLLSSVEGNTP